MPHWLTQKYPEVMQVQADGHRNLPGKRHNFCYTSPVMREKITAIDRKLSERFGRRKNVILWHISNELGGNFGDSTCHCELCQQAFREWLKRKYGTLDELNNAWWNHFWSHTYTCLLYTSRCVYEKGAESRGRVLKRQRPLVSSAAGIQQV